MCQHPRPGEGEQPGALGRAEDPNDESCCVSSKLGYSLCWAQLGAGCRVFSLSVSGKVEAGEDLGSCPADSLPGGP